MDRLSVETGVCGFFIQRAQQGFGAGHSGFVVAANAEDIAATGDRHPAPQFDLAQMGVEWAGEVGEALRVGGVEREVAAEFAESVMFHRPTRVPRDGNRGHAVHR